VRSLSFTAQQCSAGRHNILYNLFHCSSTRPVPFRRAFLSDHLIGRTNAHLQKVTRIEGVFSGTLSYIFNEFSTGSAEGPSFSTVVRTARDKGFTVRPSPSITITQNPDLTPDTLTVTTHYRSPTQRTT